MKLILFPVEWVYNPEIIIKLTINEPSFVEVWWGTEGQRDQTQQKYGDLHVSFAKN